MRKMVSHARFGHLYGKEEENEEEKELKHFFLQGRGKE